VVLLHLIAQIDPSVPVIFLNTGKLFGETLRYRDRLQEKLGLTDVRAIGPHPDDTRTLDNDGTLWSRDPDSCCNFRKVLPLRRAMAPFEAEITGRKRFQTLARTGMAPLELNGTRFVVNPLWSWSLEDLKNHILAHDLPRHPLVEDGFLSIGCMPCTQRVKDGESYRSGRWAGSDKDECGIHENIEGDGI
jgi:phosphoadenosine phosphosulfate reductase